MSAFCAEAKVKQSEEVREDAVSNAVLKEMLEELRLLRSAMTAPAPDRPALLSTISDEIGAEYKPCSTRPTPQPPRPPQSEQLNVVEVEVAVEFRRVFDILTVAQTVSGMINVTMQWEMPPGERPPPKHLDDGDWEPEWTPKFRIKRVVDDRIRRSMYTTARGPDGKMYVHAEFDCLVVVSAQLNLHNFPNDCQSINFHLQSQLAVDHAVFVPMRDGRPLVTVQTQRCLLNDFVFFNEIPFTFGLVTETISKKEVSVIKVKLNVVRQASYYIVNIGVVMFLICSFVLCAWALHPADMETRFDVDFSLILTAVAFKFILTSMLPVLSYLTVLDIYILFGFIFVGAATISHALLPLCFMTVADHSPLTLPPLSLDWEQELIDADRISFWVFAGVWFLWNAGFTISFFASRTRSLNAMMTVCVNDRDRLSIWKERLSNFVNTPNQD